MSPSAYFDPPFRAARRSRSFPAKAGGGSTGCCPSGIFTSFVEASASYTANTIGWGLACYNFATIGPAAHTPGYGGRARHPHRRRSRFNTLRRGDRASETKADPKIFGENGFGGGCRRCGRHHCWRNCRHVRSALRESARTGTADEPVFWDEQAAPR